MHDTFETINSAEPNIKFVTAELPDGSGVSAGDLAFPRKALLFPVCIVRLIQTDRDKQNGENAADGDESLPTIGFRIALDRPVGAVYAQRPPVVMDAPSFGPCWSGATSEMDRWHRAIGTECRYSARYWRSARLGDSRSTLQTCLCSPGRMCRTPSAGWSCSLTTVIMAACPAGVGVPVAMGSPVVRSERPVARNAHAKLVIIAPNGPGSGLVSRGIRHHP